MWSCGVYLKRPSKNSLDVLTLCQYHQKLRQNEILARFFQFDHNVKLKIHGRFFLVVKFEFFVVVLHMNTQL